jgi:hypothetical protein
MANAYERLAALRPANTNEAELYAVGASEYIVGTLFICNQDSSARTYNVALTDSAGAAAGEDWLAYETSISANITHKIVIPAGDGDTIRVQASIADKLSFALTGLKIT